MREHIDHVVDQRQIVTRDRGIDLHGKVDLTRVTGCSRRSVVAAGYSAKCVVNLGGWAVERNCQTRQTAAF
jgi:hypothetical protein